MIVAAFRRRAFFPASVDMIEGESW